MIFHTLNSVYRVEEKAPGAFIITKIKELRPSSYNTVGQQRMSSHAQVSVGEPAFFDGWLTSRVVRIEP